MYAVIRKCCLGPNCSYDHGGPTWNGSDYTDRRLAVVQYATADLAKANEVATNWHQYEAKVTEISEVLFDLLVPSSAVWLREWCDRHHTRVIQDLGSYI